jgi:hypothetical protein
VGFTHVIDSFAHDILKVILHFRPQFLFFAYLLQLVTLSVLALHGGKGWQIVLRLNCLIAITFIFAGVFFWLNELELLSLEQHLMDVRHSFSLLRNSIFEHEKSIIILFIEV